MKLDEVAHPILRIKACSVGRHARRTQLIELFDPLLPLLVRFIHAQTRRIASRNYTSSDP